MLFADLETYSELDIKLVSLDRYASHPSTRILMCAYAGDTGPVEIYEEADGPEALGDLQARMSNELCIAWNVGFENNLTRRVWRQGFRWRDAMVLALYSGLPAGLKACNKVPWFANESETSKETLLINKFCKPQANGTIRNRETDPEDWARFCEYCKSDVHDTRLIWQWLTQRFDMPEREWRLWEIDQRINERGAPVDKLITLRAWDEAQRLQLRENTRLKNLTQLDNPNSSAQLLPWLTERGYPFTSLGKELVKKALNDEPDKDEAVDDD